MTNRASRLIGVGAALATAAAVAAVLATGAGANLYARSTGHAVPACASSTVVNWLNTTGSGAAGSIYYQIQFTNVSSQRCSLFGYPGVSAVTAAGRQIGAAANRLTGTARAVDLAPGARAEAAWQVTETSDFTPSACRAETARGLRVYAPGSTTSDVIPFPFSTCSNARTVSLHVGPLRLG